MSKELDNLEHIQQVDKSDMLDILMDFPEQVRRALKLTDGLVLPRDFCNVSNILFTGLGGSGIGGDLIRCCLVDDLKIPFIVNRDYLTPGFVGLHTLLFANSYSGDTEETISAYSDAKKKGARIIVMTSGGKLARMAKRDGYPLIKIPGGLPPRCALGYSFAPVLAALSRIGLIKDKTGNLSEAIGVIINLRDNIAGPGVPLKDNLAKRTASLLFDRYPAIYGWSRHLDCVVTRWRNQFNENSKSLSQSHLLPEMDHNEIMGFRHPKKLLRDIVVIFLTDRGDHRRVSDRITITRSIIKERVHKIIGIGSRGKSLISRLCSLIYIGDFVSFYLAILNKEDPTPVDEIVSLKKKLAKIHS